MRVCVCLCFCLCVCDRDVLNCRARCHTAANADSHLRTCVWSLNLTAVLVSFLCRCGQPVTAEDIALKVLEDMESCGEAGPSQSAVLRMLCAERDPRITAAVDVRPHRGDRCTAYRLKHVATQPPASTTLRLIHHVPRCIAWRRIASRHETWL